MPDLVARAEQLLGITIALAPSGRAYHIASPQEGGGAYWLTRKDLEYAVECAAAHGRDAYSHWCAGTGAPMSARSMRALGIGGGQ